MIYFKRLDHILITVPVGKKEESRLFYRGVLGLEELPGDHPNGALWFSAGDIQLHIREEDAGILSERHPAFEVTDITAAKQFLESSGISISYSQDIKGRQRLFFRDPFGNRFELLEFED